ncbi:MAG: hypothetical protein ACRDF0_08405 [Candidatus Limnocylindria bacterium]
MNITTDGSQQLTREQLTALDEYHRREGWDWRNTPAVEQPGNGEDPPSDLATELYGLYVEAGLHASQGKCDGLAASLGTARRLLERLVDAAE